MTEEEIMKQREIISKTAYLLPSGSVPVSVAAKVYGKDPNWVRAGLITGYLPIGKATRLKFSSLIQKAVVY